MKAYKVTDKNMQCRGFQFELGKIYSVEGKVVPCENGFHACVRLVDCFNYYTFHPDNRVFEVELSGETIKKGDKVVARSVKLVKELTWIETLEKVNTGKGNSGYHNSGYYNSGYYNSGYCNSGNCNSGNCNSGNCNSGKGNSGNCNSGNCNSGNCNSGYCNSGYYNSGNYNSGYYNSGNYNSGNYNSGNGHFGCFNSCGAPILLFNKRAAQEEKDLLPYFDVRYTVFIHNCDLPSFLRDEGVGGILVKCSHKRAWERVWAKASQKEKFQLFSLRQFSCKVFKEVTGLDVRKEYKEWKKQQS